MSKVGRGTTGGFLPGGDNQIVEQFGATVTALVDLVIPNNAVFARVYGTAEFSVFGPGQQKPTLGTLVAAGLSNGHEIVVAAAAAQNANGCAYKLFVSADSASDIRVVWEITGLEVVRNA